MTTSDTAQRRGIAAATTTTLVAAVLSLTLTGCGTDTADADQAAPVGDRTASSEREAEPAAAGDDSGDPAPTLTSLGAKDDMERLDFPGPDVVFADSSSASSDGTTFRVTTAAEETSSVALPTESEGWIYDTTVDLGDAGTGYLLTQTGGEYIDTFLVVLDDGELYLPEPDDEVVFGQFAGEGPFFETYTTDAGAHLVTHVEDGASGDEYYEWSVVDGVMVPTRVS